MGDNVGVKGDEVVERVNDKGEDDDVVDDGEKLEGSDERDGDESNDDELESDGVTGDENRIFKEGQYGRGRIRQALCVDSEVTGTVYARAVLVVRGTAGKARVCRGPACSGAIFCIDDSEASGNLLLSILTGNLQVLLIGALGRAPRGWRVKATPRLSLL